MGNEVFDLSRFFGPSFRPKKRAQNGPFWPKWPLNGPPRGQARPLPGFFCARVLPIPPPRGGRRFGTGSVTIPESHFFTRVAPGALLLMKSGAEPGGGGEMGLRQESARIELFLYIAFYFKTSRACPLGQFPDR